MTWSRTAGAPPLTARYETISSKVCARGGTAVVPMSEEAVDVMQAWLDAQRPQQPASAAAPMSHALSREIDNFDACLRAYDAEVAKVLAEIKILARHQVQNNCRALGITIGPELLAQPVDRWHLQFALFGETHAWKTFADVDAARRGAGRIMVEAHRLQDRLERIQQCTRFEKLDLDAVVFSVGSRLMAIEGRLDAVEAENAELRQALKERVTKIRRTKHG